MAKGKKGPPVDDPIINDEGEIVEQVWVERPIQQDGLLDGGGWAQIQVPKEAAMQQLSLPKSERNAHWKNARLIEAPKAVTA
jgi:hypothetical protein